MGKVLKWRQVLKELRKNGFHPDPNHKKTDGSHNVWVHKETGRKVTVAPHHLGDDVPKGTLKSIERQSGLKF
ncbi:type II toxin-antitoxin system HicA family toxin [Thermoactinomyces sp. CICC 10521]|uniref:type II toxin-antitoxin system HicA family toxin n=1 Tax=Thermoactinomyces sp. CICC 10521 TaxID=2767426 RepID=UPI0018DD3CF9|nr:type II toxin-antitoxin system HicA family toxin [Thermoactinomyces sp. CICC 10521]